MDIKKQKEIYVKPYRQMQKMEDLFFSRLIKTEEDKKFIAKYCRLNEKLKAEEQY